MKSSDRLVRLDYLRTLIIMLVVAFHVSLTFMAEAPQWWYVKSSQTSMLFTLFVVIADVFMMPVLFFIAGYVMAFSLINTDASSFVKKRFKRIGLPWIVCTLTFAPILSLFMAQQLGHDTTYRQMISSLFWTKDYYYQGPYWFLGILLTFQLITAFADRSGKFKLFIRSIPTHVILISLLLIPAAGYSIGSFFYGNEGWQSILYIWSFQPSRILTYFCYFLSGYVLSVRKLPLAVNFVIPLVATVILGIIFIILKGESENTSSFLNLLFQGLTYSGLALSLTCLLFQLSERFLSKPVKFLSFLSCHSFSIYLVHLPIQILAAGLVIRTTSGTFLKWIILYSVIIFLSVILSIIAKVPKLPRKSFFTSQA